MQEYDCESITIKKYVNMFERIELSEYIYEGILEPSPTTYSKTSECSYNHRKRYVHHNKDRSQLSCLIHGPGHS